MANLGKIGSMIIELAVKGGEKVQKQIDEITKSIDKTNKKTKESNKVHESTFGLLTKSLGAIAGIAAAFQSPILFSYLSEFLSIIGSIGDTFGVIFGPFLEDVLDMLWRLSDWFAENSSTLAIGMGPIGNWAIFIDQLEKAGKVVLPFLVGTISKAISFLTELFAAIYNKDWNGAWNIIASAAMKVWNWIKTNIVDPFISWIWGKITNFDWKGTWKSVYNGLDKIWTEYIKPHLPGWLTDFLTWMYNFFSGDGVKKLQMIGELIVAGMDWFKLGGIAAGKFIDGLMNWLFNNPITWTIKTVLVPQNGEPGGGGGRASGGPVLGGTSYLVGEKGPELFTPSSSGSITPNSQLSDFGGQNITIVNKVELDGRQVWESVRKYSSMELRRLGGY